MEVGNIAVRPLKGVALATALATALLGTLPAGSATAATPAMAVTAAKATVPSDIQENWAESTLRSWLESGLLQGDANGRIEPNRPLNRAEWMALANRAFGFTAAGSVSFKDLSASAWEYDDVRKAVQAGYIAGYEDGTIRSRNTVSRQEAAVMLARLLKLDTSAASAAGSFADESSIADWSRGAVDALAGKHLISGYTDGSFKPSASITRAEAVVMLDKAKKTEQAASSSVAYGKPGVYGPDAGTTSVQGDVVVSSAGVTLQNMNIAGKLVLAAGVGDGDVVLKHVTVQGDTLVQGGGEHSVHIADSTVAHLVIDRQNGTVRVVAEGSTEIASADVRTPAVLEEADGLTGTGFTDAVLDAALRAGSGVTFKGGFHNVQIYAPQIAVALSQGTIDGLTVDKSAQGTVLTVQANAKLIHLILNAVAKVLGTGDIQLATLGDQALGTTFERQPLKTEGGSAGTVVAGGGNGGGTPPGNGGGSTNPGNGGGTSPGDGNGGTHPGDGGTSPGDDGEKPILTFPVVSDTHVGIEDVSVDAAAKFEKALKTYASLGTYDAIVVDGDLTDAGSIPQYEQAMSILNANKPAGAKAIIAPGNHEYYAADELNGDKYAAADRFYEETGMNSAGYDDEPVDRNTEKAGVYFDTWVKGYHFIVMDHDRSPMSDAKYEWLQNEIAAGENGKPADPGKPVFVLTHYPYSNTTYGSEGAGWNNPAEYAKFKAIMAKHPNAILITGHTHYTLEHPNTINADDGFIRINDGSTAFVQAHGYANDSDIYLDKNMEQGLLFKVYDNKVAIERRELDRNGALIGTPYEIDLRKPVESAKAYSADAAKPAFAAGAKLAVSDVSDVSATLTWPKATDDTKVDSYIVKANGKLIGAPSVISPYEEAATHTFAAKGLKPDIEYTVTVTALDAYGKESDAISASFKTASAEAGYDPQAPDVLNMDFTNVSGNTVKDGTPNHNDAVLENNAKVEDDELFGKKALELDGKGARGKPSTVARVPYNSSLFTQDTLTIEAAAYLSPNSDLSQDEYHIVGTYEDGGYYLYYSAEDHKFVFDTQNSSDPAESPEMTDVKGKLVYLTAVYDGDAANGYKNGTIKLYIDGQLAGTNTTSGPLPINEQNDLIIGGDAEAYGDVIHYFDGAIGQVKIYSRALGQDEIAADYETFKGSLPSDVKFFATDDPAVPQTLRDYAQVLNGTKTVDYTFHFQTSALAVTGEDSAVNVIDRTGKMWTGSGTTLKRFDPYSADPASVESLGEGTYFQGTIEALLSDDRYVWVLTDQGVSRIRYP